MVIARLMGGLGNQLFVYAAARRLSLKSKVPLRLDITSGFERDYYQRNYRLNHFNIKAEIASRYQSFSGSLGRVRRQILKKLARFAGFEKRRYITENFPEFDVQLLNLKVRGTIYLEGYWQSEKYFRDIEEIIREDLKIVTEHDSENLAIAEQIRSTNSVCVHVRRLREFPANSAVKPNPSSPALSADYYKRGIEIIANEVTDPIFYCFGDYPQWFIESIKINYPIVIIGHNKDEKDYEDLWLMTLCKHFIIANSTFSWWGAWLSNHHNKIIIAPDGDNGSAIPGLAIFNRDCIPPDWQKI